MPVHLLGLFSVAMISAVVGKVSSAGGLANLICVCLLVLFVVLMRIQGVRKPVV